MQYFYWKTIILHKTLPAPKLTQKTKQLEINNKISLLQGSKHNRTLLTTLKALSGLRSTRFYNHTHYARQNMNKQKTHMTQQIRGHDDCCSDSSFQIQRHCCFPPARIEITLDENWQSLLNQCIQKRTSDLSTNVHVVAINKKSSFIFVTIFR